MWQLRRKRYILIKWMLRIMLGAFLFILVSRDKGKDRPHEMAIVEDDHLLNATVTNIHNCTEWFNDTFEDNLHMVSRYQRPLDLYSTRLHRNGQKTLQFPVILTASDFWFYVKLKSFIEINRAALVPKYGDIKIIIYDIGMFEHQATTIRTEVCTTEVNCELRTFDFKKYPEHVKHQKRYSWRPIIMQEVLVEYDWVWWMDTSIELLTDDLDSLLHYSVLNSVLFFMSSSEHSVAAFTDLQTFHYLGEQPCKYRHFGEISGGFIIFHLDRITVEIINAWVGCALVEQCFAPKGTTLYKHCTNTDGNCHRFDQSVLGIILFRLFHEYDSYPRLQLPAKLYNINRQTVFQPTAKDFKYNGAFLKQLKRQSQLTKTSGFRPEFNW